MVYKALIHLIDTFARYTDELRADKVLINVIFLRIFYRSYRRSSASIGGSIKVFNHDVPKHPARARRTRRLRADGQPAKSAQRAQRGDAR